MKDSNSTAGLIITGITLLTAAAVYVAIRASKLRFLKRQVLRTDPTGDGHFGARRIHGTHRGIDLLAPAGTPVYMPAAGQVVREFYPYSNSTVIKGVEIKLKNGDRYKVMYIAPVGLGTYKKGQKIGTAQSISDYYNNSRMKDHIHIESIPRSNFIKKLHFDG